jgi:predicted Rossmann fold flavoprotein
MGATDLGYKIARQYGLRVTEVKPALVPLTLNKNDIPFFDLISGVSVDAIVTCRDISFRENILFTHRGLSGPAILQISSYWRKPSPVFINLLPDVDIRQMLEENKTSKMLINNFLSNFLPGRFTDKWCEAYLKVKPLSSYNDKELNFISGKLQSWEINPTGTEGFAKAEVTAGGIDTDELSSKTMESRKVPGLYFIGEAVDVTGWLGGYNFQWAWASGAAAGKFV